MLDVEPIWIALRYFMFYKVTIFIYSNRSFNYVIVNLCRLKLFLGSYN